MARIFKRKKGSVQDALFIALMFILFPLFIFPLVLIFSTSVSSIEAGGNDLPQVVNDFDDRLPNWMEGLYLLLLVGSYIITFILAFFIDSHPVFFIATFLIFTGMIAVIPFFINATEALTNEAAFDGIRGGFTFLPFIITNYLSITIAAWSLIAVGLYAKKASQ